MSNYTDLTNVNSKEERIVISCSRDTKIRFKQFMAKFDNYEDGLVHLLNLAEMRVNFK